MISKVRISMKYVLTISQVDTNCVFEGANKDQSQAAVADAKTVKPKADASSPKKRHGLAASVDTIGVETLTYRDPFAGVYKKYVLLHYPASAY